MSIPSLPPRPAGLPRKVGPPALVGLLTALGILVLGLLVLLALTGCSSTPPGSTGTPSAEAKDGFNATVLSVNGDYALVAPDDTNNRKRALPLNPYPSLRRGDRVLVTWCFNAADQDRILYASDEERSSSPATPTP